MSFSGSEAFTCAATSHCWGELNASCAWLCRERTLWEPVPGFLWTLPCESFAHLPLYRFAVISHSHEYNCTVNSMSPPSPSLNLGVVWRRLTYLILSLPYIWIYPVWLFVRGLLLWEMAAIKPILLSLQEATSLTHLGLPAFAMGHSPAVQVLLRAAYDCKFPSQGAPPKSTTFLTKIVGIPLHPIWVCSAQDFSTPSKEVIFLCTREVYNKIRATGSSLASHLLKWKINTV